MATTIKTAAPSRLVPGIATYQWSLSATVLALTAALVLVAPFDLALSRWIQADGLPGDLRKLVYLSEVFAHGFGVAMILVLLISLGKATRRHVPFVAACAYGSGLFAQLIKLVVVRQRPNRLPLEVTSVSDTFLTWTNARANGWSIGDYDLSSFPSGHTATATGLAIALAALYPQARWTFVGFAVLAAAQRVHTGAHYPSDVLVGAIVACVICLVIKRVHPLKTA